MPVMMPGCPLKISSWLPLLAKSSVLRLKLWIKLIKTECCHTSNQKMENHSLAPINGLVAEIKINIKQVTEMGKSLVVTEY